MKIANDNNKTCKVLMINIDLKTQTLENKIIYIINEHLKVNHITLATLVGMLEYIKKHYMDS